MRQTFDRLVGPVAIVHRALPAVLGGTSEVVPHLVPTDLDRWRVVAGTRPTAELRVDVAELRRARDDAIARAASRLGPFALGPAVGSERAATLVRTVREGYAASDAAPLRDPLVSYPAGEDPRPMWKTHVDPAFLTRDVNDAIADSVIQVLRAVRLAPDRAEDCERCAARVARQWVASDGAARLYRVTMAELRRTPLLEVGDWVAVFVHALLRSSTSARDLRVHWHSLAQMAPLLAVLAESNGAERETQRSVSMFDRPDEWHALALEVNGWIHVIDEIAMLEDELALQRRGQTVSTVGIKKAMARLHEVLRPRGLMLFHRVHDLEADDTDGIRAALERVVSDRLEACGIGADTPPGALIGTDAAVLLSVQTALAGKRCIECGRPARPGNLRCTEHQRAAWRIRKASDRKAGNGRARDATRKSRSRLPTASSRRSGNLAAPSPSRGSRRHPSRNQ